jgi:hypothetical protein
MKIMKSCFSGPLFYFEDVLHFFRFRRTDESQLANVGHDEEIRCGAFVVFSPFGWIVVSPTLSGSESETTRAVFANVESQKDDRHESR